jgi:hypothetical protein
MPNPLERWCPGAELNHRHTDFQSSVQTIKTTRLALQQASNRPPFSAAFHQSASNARRLFANSRGVHLALVVAVVAGMLGGGLVLLLLELLAATVAALKAGAL